MLVSIKMGRTKKDFSDFVYFSGYKRYDKRYSVVARQRDLKLKNDEISYKNYCIDDIIDAGYLLSLVAWNATPFVATACYGASMLTP